VRSGRRCARRGEHLHAREWSGLRCHARRGEHLHARACLSRGLRAAAPRRGLTCTTSAEGSTPSASKSIPIRRATVVLPEEEGRHQTSSTLVWVAMSRNQLQSTAISRNQT
jgi:hypothetical protein